MYELREIFKKIKLENLISYFIFDSYEYEIEIEDYEQKLGESYDILLEKIRNICPDVGIHEDDLFDAVTDFATIHDDVYFEMGILIGFQLFKNMEDGYKKI